METRKPRPSRFGTESQEARLARLRESAPTLVSSGKMRLYALFGSVLLVLTVAGFYFAMQIYKAAVDSREQATLIEVDRVPEITLSETQKVLARLEQEEAEAEAAFEEQLKALQEVDLLEQLDEPEKTDQPDR